MSCGVTATRDVGSDPKALVGGYTTVPSGPEAPS